ncbi:unnamed protein product [Paramecium primaurelia]|uniref:RING-type domain-containing protein n=1 Tax=Paramecium primaurelia TaxID=5886 RepID=A0A8S1PGG1_PARPR|nr:unnamed protein product [Paramecium primaurelia]
MLNYDKLQLAPNQFRWYLIQNHTLNLIQGTVFCQYYLDNLINGKLPFSLAWFRCSYLFLIFILSLSTSILYVLIIPQLITLNQKNKRDFIIQLEQFLNFDLNFYMNEIQCLLEILYFLAYFQFLWNSITSQDEDINYIIITINYLFYIQVVKQSIKIYLDKKLEKSILEEQLKKIIEIQQLNEHIEINKELCPICHDYFKYKDLIAYYLCQGKHKFHKECIIKWLDQSSNQIKTCPICRQQASIKSQLIL